MTKPNISPEIDPAIDSIAARRARLIDAYAAKLEAAIARLKPADAEWADVVAGLKLLGQFKPPREAAGDPAPTDEPAQGPADPLTGLVLKLPPVKPSRKAARRRRRAG